MSRLASWSVQQLEIFNLGGYIHSNSKLLFEKYGKPSFRPGSRVLEIGPDAFPSSYASLVNDASITWETADISDQGNVTYPQLRGNMRSRSQKILTMSYWQDK
jgi:hypothetical protein